MVSTHSSRDKNLYNLRIANNNAVLRDNLIEEMSGYFTIRYKLLRTKNVKILRDKESDRGKYFQCTKLNF
jgi:hypothetical protein